MSPAPRPPRAPSARQARVDADRRALAESDRQQVVRVPPHDDLAEAAVLGTVLLDPARFAQVEALLAPEDCYRERNQAVFALMRELDRAGRPIDLVTLFEAMERQGITARCGGISYLDQLQGQVPNVTAVEHYARIVQEKARARRLIEANHAANTQLYHETGELPEILAEQALAVDRALGGHPSADAGVASALDEARALRERRRDAQDPPVPLPWPELAGRLGGGLWPGLHILVGHTGTGKTQWALQVALAAARSGHPALYVGLELARTEVAHRLLALAHPPDTRVPWADLHRGRGQPDPAVERELTELPLHIEAAAPYAWTPAQLPVAVRRLRQGGGWPVETPVCVVLDFLQVAGGDAKEEVRQRVQRAAYACRAAARDLNAAVLAISSTGREHYARLSGSAEGAGPPWQEDAGRLVGLGKESGEVEYSADTVLVLVAETPPTGPDGTPSWPADGLHVHLGLAKNRTGRTGWAELRFDGNAYGEPTPPRPVAFQSARGARR